MAELDDLYQNVILDHNRRPRNFHPLEGEGARKAEGYNPLCGDQLTIWVRLSGDTVEDASFQGSGCAISKASASLMTAAVKGKSRAEAERMFEQFHRLVTGRLDPEGREALGRLAVLGGVAEFPIRVKCASLPWHTLKAALNAPETRVSTE